MKEDLPISLPHLIYVVVVANFGPLLCGYEFGATSWLLIGIQDAANSSTVESNYYSWVTSSVDLRGMVAAGALIGSTLTYLILLFVGHRIPKKTEILLSAFLYFVGAFLNSISGIMSWDYSWHGLAVLMSGQLLYGAGIATAFHSVPQYISEICPPNIRGKVGSGTEALAVIGIASGFIVGYLYEGKGWVGTFRVAYSIAIFYGIASTILPRSLSGAGKENVSNESILQMLRFLHPSATEEHVVETREKWEDEEREKKWWERRWEARLRSLRLKNAYHPATGIREKTFGGGRSDDVVGSSDAFASVFKYEEDSFGEDRRSFLAPEVKVLFSDPILLRCLYLAVTVVILQIFTGQSAMLYFAGDIFSLICPSNRDMCIVSLGLIKLVSTLGMVIIADTFGRRFFLLAGTITLLFGMMLLDLGLSFHHNSPALIGFYMSVCGYQMSFGSMLWVMLSEIFPQYVRSTAVSL